VEVRLPGGTPFKMELVSCRVDADEHICASLRALPTDWAAFRAMSLWMFHTPEGAVSHLPAGVPVIATVW
jgi:cellulose synthase (UDP-forming)